MKYYGINKLKSITPNGPKWHIFCFCFCFALSEVFWSYTPSLFHAFALLRGHKMGRGWLIADVADSKRHHQLDEILIIFTCTIQKISKVVCKKILSKTRAFITSLCFMKRAHYSKCMLRKQDCVKFSRAYCMTEFFENNFADFSDVVRVKKIKI